MGNLLKVLTYNELEQGPNFFLDFESEMGFLFSFVSYLMSSTSTPFEFPCPPSIALPPSQTPTLLMIL